MFLYNIDAQSAWNAEQRKIPPPFVTSGHVCFHMLCYAAVSLLHLIEHSEH